MVRNQVHMSQSELAEKLHVSRQAISNWERGLSEPDIQSLTMIADIFHITLSQLVQSNQPIKMIPEIVQKRIHSYLLGQSLLSILYIILCIYLEKNRLIFYFSGILPLLMNATIVGAFGYSVKHDDFTMIAGYCDDVDYHKEVLKEMLVSIQHHIVLLSFGIHVLLYLSLFIEASFIFLSISIVMYIANVIVTILFMNYRYRNRMFVHEKDRVKIKKAIPILLSFLGKFTLGIVVFISSCQLYELKNNTPEIMLCFLPFLLYMVLHIILLFMEQIAIEKGKDAIRGGKYWAINIISCLLLVAVWYIASKN